MTLIRVLVSAAAALTHTFYVDETPTDATTGVAVTVKRLDGTTVTSGAATHPGVGQYAFTVPGQSTLDTLTVDWVATSIGGAVVTARDYVEVVGGFLFGLKEARDLPTALDSVRFPAATLARKRIEVEQECEAICRQAFVPRFTRVALTGTGTDRLPTPHMLLRAVRAVTADGVAWQPADVAAVLTSDHGVLRRPGGALWAADTRYVLELEHGMDYPPEDLRAAAMLRLRSRLTMTDSGVPQRAISFSVADGGVYRLSTPSRQRTGIPDVDGVYERHTRQPRTVFA